MKFTVKTTGNWAEVKEFETLKEALQEFEMVAQGSFHYHITKSAGCDEVILEADGEAIIRLYSNSVYFVDQEIGNDYIEFTEYDADFPEPSAKGQVLIHHYNADGAHNIGEVLFDTYTVQYDC